MSSTRSKGVLLLGRFTEGRIQILEKLREKLRSLGFLPMVFNFDKPETKNFTETVRLLATGTSRLSASSCLVAYYRLSTRPELLL